MLSGAGAYGVKPGHRLYNELGANLKIEVNTTLWKIVSLYSRLSFYSNYMHKPLNIDIRWDFQLKITIAKWFLVNVNMNLLYDDDIAFLDKQTGRLVHSKLQFKELAGLGIQFKF